MPEALSCQFPQLLLCLLFSALARFTVLTAGSQGLGLSEAEVSRPGAQWVEGGGKGNIRVCRGWVRGPKEGWGHGVCTWGEGRAGRLRNGLL